MLAFNKIKSKFLKWRRQENNNDLLFLGSALNLSDKRISRRQRINWLEESLVNYSDGERAITDINFLGVGLSRRRQLLFFLVVIVGLAMLFGRAMFLQIVKGQYYLNIAEKNRIRIYNLPAPRGIIYDRDGAALVKNVPGFAIFIVPSDLQSTKDRAAQTIAWLNENLGQDNIQAQLVKILSLAPGAKEYYEPVLLTDNLQYEQALAMRIDSLNYPGVSVEVASKREYLNYFGGRLAGSLSHILGYEGKINPDEYVKFSRRGYLLNDYIGKTGVEAALEEMLRGAYGKKQVEVDSAGKVVKILAEEELRKGDNLYLSIDLNLQLKLETIISERINRLGKNRAVGIVENPNNGQILAMVSLPSFNNNDFAKGITQSKYEKLASDENNPLYNRAVSGEYPSGSIIKPIIAVAALEEGIINENTSFLSVGGIKISNWFFPDWKAGGHGITNVRLALAESVNSFFYIIGGGFLDFDGLGVYKIKEYAEKFGLNKAVGIDLPNEKTGFLPTPEWKMKVKGEQWYIGDTYHESIGQGDLLVTPLQVVNYTSVFANRGTLYKPQILSKYYCQEKNELKMIEPEILNAHFIKPDNLEIVRQGMRQTVTTGTAKIFNALPVVAAAKTGTAQWQEGKNAHSWFTAFAPYERPEIVVTILVEEGGEGTAIAAPIAFEFMNWYFREYKK